jgi:hypothetical protein
LPTSISVICQVQDIPTCFFNVNNFGLGNPSSIIDNNVESGGDDETVYNVAANLLPPKFKKTGFLTPEMVKYHENEQDHEHCLYCSQCYFTAGRGFHN